MSRAKWEQTPWARFQRFLWLAATGLSSYTLCYVGLKLAYTPWFSESSASLVFASSWLASNLVLLAHVVLAAPCILTGPFLFMTGLRDRRPRLHRWLGYFYVVPVLLSAVTGFALAVSNPVGLMGQTGFATLACVWFTTTSIALRYALKKDWVHHRRWMLRSYATSLAVVTVRFLPPPFGMTFTEWYPYLTWVCWVPNIILGETYVRVTAHSGKLIRPAFLVRALTPRVAQGGDAGRPAA